VVAAAKREGKVTIVGPEGADTRDVLTQGFQQKYPEIEVDYSGSPGSQLAPKLLAERAAGKYLADIAIAGTDTLINSLRPTDALEPMAAFLVGPEANPSLWTDGQLDFADDARSCCLVTAVGVKTPLAYNKNLVSPSEFRSWRDLANPKWRGKLSMRDPRQAGTGSAMFAFWYTSPSLGREFVRQMLDQQIVFSNNDRQIIDWMAKEQYPVSVAMSERSIADPIEKGLPLAILPPEAVATDRDQELTYLTAGASSIAVLTHAPHPNAARVYLDYLLSRENQLEWSKVQGYPSFRLDVSRDHLPDYIVPKPGFRYKPDYKEQHVVVTKVEAREFLNSILGP
jgi:iron(III) transport system substrate-binding protein